jgi:formiminotetrahydrofolate cyclodeaminase
LDHADTSLWLATAAELRDRVASTDPTPGGGSVSIVTAALGLALIQKGVVVSLKKSAANIARHQKLLELNLAISNSIVSLSAFADADSLAFKNYLEAGTLPQTTEAEVALRQAAREAYMVRATQIPIESAVKMGRGVKLGEAAAQVIDAHVRSEVLAGVVLLRASIKSVLLSVDANLSRISNSALRDTLKLQRSELERAFTLPPESVAPLRQS